jgi:hypothetical protein
MYPKSVLQELQSQIQGLVIYKVSKDFKKLG